MSDADNPLSANYAPTFHDADARARNYGFTTSSDDTTADNPVNWWGEEGSRQ